MGRKRMAPFEIKPFETEGDSRKWALYEVIEGESKKLVSRHFTRIEAREAKRALMKEERSA